MSQGAKIKRNAGYYSEHCLARIVPENSGHRYPCEHAPDGNMVWGSPPRLFCTNCIHFTPGHMEEADEED